MPRQERFRLVPMRPRNPHERGRVASTLELFFDLVFVIAVSNASTELYRFLTDGQVGTGIINYLLVFFAIFWAWANFTWFSTAFDTDDWLYRVMTIIQMGGVLVLAAGIAPAFEQHDFRVLVIAYVVMRLAMVGQWLRAARAPGPTRVTALTYAVSIAGIQILWILSLLAPPSWFWGVTIALLAAEVSVPIIAGRRGGPPPWHQHHITERYGLFTLILLGESLLGSSNAIFDAVRSAEFLWPLIELGSLTLITIAALWWIYFWPPHHLAVRTIRGAAIYAYFHVFIFAAAGAFSSGIEVEIDVIDGHSALHAPWAALSYTIPIAVFLIGVWLLAIRPYADTVVNVTLPAAAVLVLIDPLIPVPFALTSLILIATVAILVWRQPLIDRSRGMANRHEDRVV